MLNLTKDWITVILQHYFLSKTATRRIIINSWYSQFMLFCKVLPNSVNSCNFVHTVLNRALHSRFLSTFVFLMSFQGFLPRVQFITSTTGKRWSLLCNIWKHENWSTSIITSIVPTIIEYKIDYILFLNITELGQLYRN